MGCSFSSDALNKFSQLTPWVQAFVSAGFFGMLVGGYFIERIVVTLAMRRQ